MLVSPLLWAEDLPSLPSDSLAVDSVTAAKYASQLDSLSLEYAQELGLPIEDLSDNPLYYRLFMPLTLYDDAIFDKSPFVSDEESDELGVDEDMDLKRQINEMLVKVYLSNPELVERTEAEMKEAASDRVVIDNTNGVGVGTTELGPIQVTQAVAPEMVVVKPRYWKHPGKSVVKFTQSHYSDNWYKGGESNQSLLVQLQQEMNYAKNQLTFDNKLEAKLGYYTTTVNDEKTFKTNEDLFRVTSKFGLKAFKYWYYSGQIQAYTQFMDVRDNNDNLKSKFLAPGYANVSLGMDYKPKFKNNNWTLSLQISPLSFNSRYVSVVDLAKKYGIDEGKKFKYTIGSRLECNWTCKFLKDFKWTGKVQYYTNYKYVEANWENTLDYSISKYFSLQMFFHYRYDDSVNPDADLHYNQFRDFLTLNFTYSW